MSNEWVNVDYNLMVWDAPSTALKAKAGQFFQLLCPPTDGYELSTRRPMSIYEVDIPSGQIKFLYKCVGRGTQGMAYLKIGDSVGVIGAGPIGLFCIQVAKAAGASLVIVSEPVKTRREAALKVGADVVIDPTDEDVIKVREIITY